MLKIRPTANILATIPLFISVNICALLIWLLDISQQTMPIVLGVIGGGLVDLDNRLSGRLKNIFYTLLAFSVSSFSIQYLIDFPIIFFITITAMTFVLTMLGAIGIRYSTIAFGTLVVAVYTLLAYSPNQPAYLNPILILCGTLIYSLLAVLTHLFFPNRPVQENVAKVFNALADYLETKADFFDPDSIEELEKKQIQLSMKNSLLMSRFDAARNALFSRISGQHRQNRTNKLLGYYFIAQDIHERANSSHFNYQLLAEKLKNSDLIFRVQRLLELQAQACREIAAALKQNQHYHYDPRLERAINGINLSFELYAKQVEEDLGIFHIRTLLDNLQGVDWQLRHIAQPQEKTEQQMRIYQDNISGLPHILGTICSHLHFQSQLFRHAIRLSLVVLSACAIVQFFELERGYWILLTGLFVCQPNYSATKLRLKQRIIGTIAGVIIGSLLPYFTSTLEAKLGIVVLSSTLFYFFRTNNYSFSTFFITIQVLAGFDIMGFDIYDAMGSRIMDTLIGTGIAWFAVTYLWPDWKYLQLSEVSQKAIAHNAEYLLYITAQLQFGKIDDAKYRTIRRYAYESATALSNTVSNMNNEPQKYAQYLPQSFELLKMNASLLSYISALGAYRKQMSGLNQPTDFTSVFYPTVKKLIGLLQHIKEFTPQQIELQQLNISLLIKEYTQKQQTNTELRIFNVPIQQLDMINQILPALSESLKKVK